MAAGPVPTGVLVHQGPGCLSPSLQAFLLCSNGAGPGEDGGEDPRFYIISARAVPEAVQRGAMECPAMWIDSAAVDAGSGALQAVYRLGGTPVCSRLPFKPVRLQPVKQPGAGPGRPAFRAFVSSSTYTQAYRISEGLLPKLHTLHNHLASSGIPIVGLLQPGNGSRYSCDGLRAMPLHEGLLLERCELGSGQLRKLRICINFHNACLELHDAPQDAAGSVNKCLRTINTLAEAVVALEGRPGAAGGSPLKSARRGGGDGSVPQSPAKAPLPSGLDSVRHGIVLIQACSAAHLREGVALLSAAAGSPQLAASAVIMGGLEALVSAAATVLPCPTIGMAELHMLLSQALGGLLDAAPPSAHAAARTATVVGAVLAKNCANPLLLARLLVTLLQRPGMRLETVHQGLASAISAAYIRLAPNLEAAAAALLAAHVQALAGEGDRGEQQQQQQPGECQQLEQPRAAAAPAEDVPPTPAAAVQPGVGTAHSGAFGSPQVLLADTPAPVGCRAARAAMVVSPPPASTSPAALPAVRARSPGAVKPLAAAAIYGREGYVRHIVSTFNAIKAGPEQQEQQRCGSPTKAGGVLTRQDSNSGAWSPPKASSPTRSVSAMSNGSMSRVPRLTLPGADSPTNSAGGLTRSTRRTLSTIPGRRSPSPTRWGSMVLGRTREEEPEQSASSELAALASAVGEAIVAADLPAIIAHKRRALASLSFDEELPPELPQPPTPGVRKSLEAHKILVTAKSLRSLDSSQTCTTEGAPAAAGGGSSARQAADTAALKCLLLEALLAALPVVGSAGYPDLDPSPVLALEVLSVVSQNLSPQQEQLQRLRQQALQQLALPAASRGADAMPHVLLALAACKLAELVPGLGAQGLSTPHCEAAALLQLMTEYVSAAPGHEVAPAAVRHCYAVVQALLGTLLAAGADVAEWNAGAWRLLHRLVALLAALCRRCHDARAGRTLLRMLLADQQTAAMLSAASSLLLLHPEAAASPGFAYRSGTALVQRELLHLLVELAALVGRQPAAAAGPVRHGVPEAARVPSRLNSLSSSLAGDEGTAISSPGAGPASDLMLAPGPKGGKRLSRAEAYQFLWPFISPLSGFVARILDHEGTDKGKPAVAAAAAAVPPTPATPASGDSMRLRHDVLQLLRVAFSAPGNPFVQDKATTDWFIQFHFIQFLKLYHNPQRDHQALALCRKHMEVLLALASHKSPQSRKRFQQLSVMDFFVREVSLEFESSEPSAARARASRSGSVDLRRRSSSFSLDGDTTRRLSDRSGGREAPQPALPTLPKPEGPLAPTPPPQVPSLRLAFKPAESSFSVQQHQQQQPGHHPQQQQQGGGTPLGRPALALAIPRLNLPGTPPLGSPVEGASPTAPSSARLGRPPLPPSARTARLGTPRTSRLGRPADVAPAAVPSQAGASSSDAGASKLSKPPLAIHVHAGPVVGGNEPAPTPPAGRLSVPKLALGRTGLGLAVSTDASSSHAPSRLQLASPGGEGAGLRDSQQAPGWVAEADSDASSDEEGTAVEAASRAGSGCAPAAPRQVPGGLRVPPGFVWSGDLDEDVARLEAMEELEEEEEEARSPTIPAHHHRHFGAPEPEPEPAESPTIAAVRDHKAAGGGLPRLALALPGASAKASPALGGGLGKAAQETVAAAAAGAKDEPEGAKLLLAIPRLNLSPSMHSTLETRTASAELQVALEAERAKRKVGRTFLGDLEKSTLGKGKMQAAGLYSKHLTTERMGAVSLEVSYEEERSKRLLYKDDALHLQVLHLIFTLLLGPEGTMDPAYADTLPWQRKMLNIPHILHHHFNHAEGAARPLLGRLLPLLQHSAGAPALRLLRVLCGAFFRPQWYAGHRQWIGKGAYAQVYRYQLPDWAGEGTVVFKVLDLPRHFEDHCRQVDFFNEVSIMEGLAGSPRAAQLLDYGIDTRAEVMFLVMRDYRCSLRKWREAQPADPRGQLRLYLAIFQQVLSAVKSLMEANVLHFDLKCDNVLLEPLPGVGEAEFWAPAGAAPPFRVVLADFGESKLFTGSLDGAVTVRNRGTECAKSPEMLLAANAYKKDAMTYDRRQRKGAGAASDVWSLGCLLFELVTGEFLFSVEPDWVRFFVHITDPRSGPLITPDKAQAVQHLPGVLGLLQFILVRDSRLRPTLHDVQTRVEALLAGSRVRLPSYVPPTPTESHRAGGLLSGTSSRPLQSPTLLGSPRLAAPLPLLAPLPLAPGLLLAPLSAAQSAAALQQRPLARVVLVVGGIVAGPEGCALATARSSRVARTLVPGGASSAGPTPRPGAHTSNPPSAGGDVDGCSPESSPLRSGRYGSSASSVQPPQDILNPLFSPGQAGAPSCSSAAASRLATPRSGLGGGSSATMAAAHAVAEPSALVAAAAAAESRRRPVRPLFNSGRVHAASAADVPAVFEVARGPELGGCAEWPGSGRDPPSGNPPQRLSSSGEVSARSRRATGTPPLTPRRYQPLLPAGLAGGGGPRSAAEDAAYRHLLNTPELAQCGAACSAAGVECRVVPCPDEGGGMGDGGSGGAGGSSSSRSAVPASSRAGGPWRPPTPLQHWLRTALPLLEASGSSTSTAEGEEWEELAGQPRPADQQRPAVLLAAQPGCEPAACLLCVAHLMRQRRVGLYQAMVAAAQWGLDLHLGEAHMQALRAWAAAEGVGAAEAAA